MRLATVLIFLALQNGELKFFKGYFHLIVRRTCKQVTRKLFLSIAAAVVLVLAVLFAVSGTVLIICFVMLAFMCYRRRKTKYKTLTQSTQGQDAHLSFAETKEPLPDSEPSV